LQTATKSSISKRVNGVDLVTSTSITFNYRMRSSRNTWSTGSVWNTAATASNDMTELSFSPAGTDVGAAGGAVSSEGAVGMSGRSNAIILIADDDARNREALRELLEGPGQTVVAVDSGAEVLRQALRRDFALIVLDIHMPEMDGFETAAFLRQRKHSRSTPIIFLTGAYEDVRSIVRGYEAGAVDYIVKPVVPEVLKSKVAVFVDLHRKNAELALAERQEWKALESQIKAAGSQKKAAQFSRLPSLRFDGDFAYVGTSGNTTLPTYTYQASVNLPIFTGGRIHAEIVRADLEIRKLEQQQADLRNQIALDVKTALLNLNSARNEVQVANLGVVLSKEEVDQARDRFKAGVANNIEVIQAQDALSRANDNQIAALYRFNQARADLARSIGQMEKVYSK
jgi:CheY-like chemotaxis protein